MPHISKYGQNWFLPVSQLARLLASIRFYPYSNGGRFVYPIFYYCCLVHLNKYAAICQPEYILRSFCLPKFMRWTFCPELMQRPFCFFIKFAFSLTIIMIVYWHFFLTILLHSALNGSYLHIRYFVVTILLHPTVKVTYLRILN